MLFPTIILSYGEPLFLGPHCAFSVVRTLADSKELRSPSHGHIRTPMYMGQNEQLLTVLNIEMRVIINKGRSSNFTL
jgi:hypothetical protein